MLSLAIKTFLFQGAQSGEADHQSLFCWFVRGMEYDTTEPEPEPSGKT